MEELNLQKPNEQGLTPSVVVGQVLHGMRNFDEFGTSDKEEYFRQEIPTELGLLRLHRIQFRDSNVNWVSENGTIVITDASSKVVLGIHYPEAAE